MEMKRKEKAQIIYEPEDAYSAEAFRKYLFLEGNQIGSGSTSTSKTGGQLKAMIQTSDQYL